MPVTPRLVGRHEGIVDLAIRNGAVATGYRLSGAMSINAAAAGATAMVTVDKGAMYRSPALVRSGANRVEGSNSHLTRIMYAPSDFAAATIPGDGQMVFLTIEEREPAGTFLAAGPIMCVPPPQFFATGRRSMTLIGNAVAVAGLANNQPPPGALRLTLPKYSDNILIESLDTGTSGDAMFISFGSGLQEVQIAAGTTKEFVEPGASEIYIRCAAAATADFQMVCNIVNGLES